MGAIVPIAEPEKNIKFSEITDNISKEKKQ